MPTKKRRVGFIPRIEVLDLINKISYENNLSNAKVINILVEEALYKRGLFDLNKDNSLNKKSNPNKDEESIETKKYINQVLNYNFKKKLLNDENLNPKEVKVEPFDNEIYSKFLIFLQFQERMKKIDS